MDIFEFAMKMEMDGKKFYEAKAESTPNKELKEILNTLAEEELAHFKFFKMMRDGDIEEAAAELSGSSKKLTKVKNIFATMAENDSQESFGEDAESVWTEALRIEENAEGFYLEKAKEEPDADKRKLLELIAAEERNHIHMISGVLSYIKYPDQFAASAQFKDFQSLEGH